MARIHPMAVVEAGAELADDVVVGAFAFVGGKVKLGKGCVVMHHATVEGNTTAGEGNEFYPQCVIGGLPQDLKYRGGDCRVVIGSRNKFRELCTVNMGTEDGGGITQVGDDNLLMTGAHIAHDCILGSHCVIANNVLLAGHVLVEDWVVLSGAVASHHFVRFGQHSFVGGVSTIVHDVPPFMIADGHPAVVRGINRNGIKRRGFSDEAVEALKTAYRMLFNGNGVMSMNMEKLREMYPESKEIGTLLAFIQDTMAGKFGRYRESLRGKQNKDTEQEDPGTVSGN